MTRRSSPRAQAQEIYRAMVAQQAAAASAATSDPSSLRFDGQAPTPGPSPLLASARGGGEHAGPGEGSPKSLTAQSLTEKVRALYEGSAVPVAAIAALAGVTERTIYKYAAKQNWTPRYRWTADGARPRGERRRPRVKRGDRWAARAKLAPVKGAGGRFVRRAAAGQPVARGLRATDAAGAARASAACTQADAVARQAQRQAEMVHWFGQRMRAWDQINRMLGKIDDYTEAYRKTHDGQAVPADDKLLWAMRCTLNATMDWLEAIRREEAEQGG